MSNVFSFVANATGYQNVHLDPSQFPLTNLTGIYNGPLNAQQYVPFLAPNTSAVGAGGQGVFVAASLNTSFTAAVAPAPVNLTALNQTVPAAGPANASSSGSAPSPTGSGTSGATRVGVVGGLVMVGPVLAAVCGFL